MAKHDKLYNRLMSTPPPKDFTYDELETVATHLGFKKLEGSGSRVKFRHETLGLFISIHKPHPGNELKEYVVRQVQEIFKGCKDGNT